MTSPKILLQRSELCFINLGSSEGGRLCFDKMKDMGAVTRILFVVCALFPLSKALQMELKPNSQRCVGQILDVEDIADFSVQVIARGNEPETKKSGVSVWIDAPNNARLFSKELTYAVAETKVHPPQTGLHQLCFQTRGSAQRVYFNIDVDTVKSNEKFHAPLEPLQPDALLHHLRLAERELQNINLEADFQRRQEAKLQRAADRTNRRMHFFSAISVIVLLGTSVWQIVYLRQFFTAKKLL